MARPGKAILGKCASSKPSLGDVMDVGKLGGLGLNRSRLIGSIYCRVEWRVNVSPPCLRDFLPSYHSASATTAPISTVFYKRVGERNWTSLSSPPFSI